ncbi:FmdB family zinc ribbon protein [Parageobacillus thermoglucosidasius]|uniref:Regulatory protein FmdB Zinc ribbon domain-containing protein n=2 Tax=Parageobacillus thermoglucosidasius TaxID=1426 RepID=A0AB38R3Y9_PARTM|nr:FmdB family zinc ribbon protein [Parageobacillus thermoglucosidasius]UOE77165.1 hypothetical protein IMI45_04730 [Parageobacillus thermoglucosidasius]
MRKASCFEAKILVHVYECQECDVIFAVSQSFEEQPLLQCPVCKTDKALHEVSAGELHIRKKVSSFVVPEGQTNIYEFLG